MSWSLPVDWELPVGENFYTRFKRKGELFTMTKPDYDKIKDHLRSKRKCVDIGAHIGTTVARYAYHFEKVYAFEPMHMKICKKNVGHLENVEFYSVALSDRTGTVDMVMADGNSGASSVQDTSNKETLNKSVLKFNQKNKISVESKTLDSYQFKEIDFIKMDTEGYVLPVLEGMRNTIIDNEYPILQIEFNGLCPNKEECLEWLDNLGYKLYDTYHVDHFFKVMT